MVIFFSAFSWTGHVFMRNVGEVELVLSAFRLQPHWQENLIHAVNSISSHSAVTALLQTNEEMT